MFIGFIKDNKETDSRTLEEKNEDLKINYKQIDKIVYGDWQASFWV